MIQYTKKGIQIQFQTNVTKTILRDSAKTAIPRNWSSAIHVTCKITASSSPAVLAVPRPADWQITHNPGGCTAARPSPAVTERPREGSKISQYLNTALAKQNSFFKVTLKYWTHFWKLNKFWPRAADFRWIAELSLHSTACGQYGCTLHNYHPPLSWTAK